MGILCDFFVSTPDDAPLYERLMIERALTDDRFPHAQWKGFTSLQIEILWALADGREWNPETHTLDPIGEPEESWLFRFPDAFVDRLASTSESEARRLAEVWSKTEEIDSDPREIEPVIASLVSLARNAKETSRGLFLWGSL